MKLVDYVFESEKKYLKNIAYSFMGKKTTYETMAKRIDDVALCLLNLGLKDGDIVCIAMPNTPQAILTIYACNKIGVTVNMIHPLSSENEFLTFVNKVKASTILIIDQFVNKIEAIREKTNLKNIIVASVRDELSFVKKVGYDLTLAKKTPKFDASKVLMWTDFIKNKANVDLSELKTKNEIALILHSGGTTGKVKGVCLSNTAVNASAEQMLKANPMIDNSDRFLSVMPIFHGNGLVIGVHSMLMLGARCVLIPRFTPETYAKDLIKNKCNYMSGVPALFERLMGVEIMKKADLSFLKGAFSGADYLSVELERKINVFLKEHNAKVPVRQGYGMTEGVVATTLNPVDKQKEGSIGVALPGVEVKIVKPGTEEEVKTNEVGEIVFSSITNMSYYYNDPEETDISMKKHKDGKYWIHSGDLGSVDEDGFFFFKGRIKRMIVTNGYNVFPNELENIIESFEMVDRSCVLALPYSDGTDRIQTFITLKKGFAPSEELKAEIKSLCAKNIAKYALPKKITFIDKMPTTKVGKVDFNALLKGEFNEAK